MSEQRVNDPLHSGTNGTAGGQFHLLNLLIVLGRNKKLVIGLPAIGGALALTASLVAAPTFSSTAAILPPEPPQGGVNVMLGQFEGLGNLLGMGPIRNPADRYVTLMQSRTVADKLISRFQLQERYKTKTPEDTRKVLTTRRIILNDRRDGTVTVTVSDKDADFAAALANGYVEELVKFNQALVLENATQRRVFLEKRLMEAKNSLAGAEAELLKTRGKAAGTGRTAAKDAELNGKRGSAASTDPVPGRAQDELRAVQAQLTKLEATQSSKAASPDAPVEHVGAARDVKYYETLFELLGRQYEMARIEEALALPVQVLDKAVPGESKPQRLLVTLGGIAAGAILGIWLAFIKDAIRRSRANPLSAGRWQQLAAVWKTKR